MSTLKVTNIESPSGGGVSAKITDIGGGQLSNRNLIINGAMQVAQRFTSVSSVVGSGYYTVDRFQLGLNTLGTYTLTQESDGPEGFSKSFKIDCTTADASPASSDFLAIYQHIEAQDLQHLGYGTSSAKPLTLTFYVKSNKTGNASFEIQQPDNSDRQVCLQYTINAANTWEKKTLSIPADTSGLINDDNGSGLRLGWWLNSGSDFTGGSHQTTWTAEVNTDRNASNLGIGGSTSDYWQITGVQLEVGDTATSFEHRSYGDELARCQRYYQTGACWMIGFGSTNGFIGSAQNFNTYMRVNNPNVVLGTPTENVNFASIGAPAVYGNGFRLFGTITTGANINAYYTNTFTASAEL